MYIGYGRGLVLVVDLFGGDDGEVDEAISVKRGFMHIDGGNLVIVIGSVIANTLFEVVAGRINCDLVFIIT